MSENTSTITTQPAPKVKKKKRVFMWVFLAVQAIFLIWIITGVSGNSGHATDCGSLSQADCDAAADIGTGIGVFLIIGVWFFVDCFMAVAYAVYRMAKRP